MVKPWRRWRSRTQSPWVRWKSTLGSSGREAVHPNCGRRSRSVAGVPASSGTHVMSSVLFPRKASSPPGRRSRAASATHRSGSAQMAAPYSLITRSNAPPRSAPPPRRPHQREGQPVLALHPPGDGQLARRGVDAHRAGAAAGQPRRHVARPTPQLDHGGAVEPVGPGQEADLPLGDAEDAPGRLLGCPRPASQLQLRRRPGVPLGGVGRHVAQVAAGRAVTSAGGLDGVDEFGGGRNQRPATARWAWRIVPAASTTKIERR